MRVYLDNCCYNRPFDDWHQNGGKMIQTTDNELSVKCMNVLVDAVGPVDAERFVSMVTNAGFDYTEWQRGLFEGETVDSLFEKVKSFDTNKELCC